MLFAPKKRVALTYNDYKIQLLNFMPRDLTKSSVFEQELTRDIVRDGVVIDEIAFFETIKKIVKDYKLKGQQVIFAIPDNAVTMRSVEHPQALRSKSIKEHFEMEVGNSLHLPFDEAIIDIYDRDDSDGIATIFATNSTEIMKVQEILEDAGLKPYAADAQTLANLRVVEKLFPTIEQHISMVLTISINEFSLAIYSNKELEFIRYHAIETELEKWQAIEIKDGIQFQYNGDIEQYKTNLMDALAEISRIMNFYRFSVNKETQSIEQMMLVGDNPELPYIQKMLESQFDMPVYIIDDARMQHYFPKLTANDAEIVGLALKEELPSNIPSINLLPVFKQKKKQNRAMIWLTAILVTLAIVAIAVWNNSLSSDIEGLQSERTANEQAVEKVQQEIDAYKLAEEDSLQQAVQIVELLAYPVTPVIEAINQELKDYEYKTKLQFDSTSANVEVHYETFSDIANYIDMLQTNKLFTDIKVETIDLKVPNKSDYTAPVDEPVVRHVAKIELTLNQTLLQKVDEPDEK